ncbi:MAG: hypothetical protein HY22_06935 [[Candidatus Thermochlorobacteriaceae] bacterium GBChlB]|nr:MAG: hypothetical protein HY22_06935 [[Candidatus Thermochlorobacteriaceae] bacterium GBChlB]
MQTEAAIEAPITRRKITVEEYYVMYNAGVFKPDERLELINGEIVKMPAMNAPHIAYVARLSRLFIETFGKRATVFTQLPVILSDDSEPEPDIALLKWKADDYLSGKATASDVHVLIEVADASLLYDRRIKLPLYASAGIPEAWVLNLQDNQLEVYRQPRGNNYAEQRLLKPSEKISLQAFPDVEISLTEIFISPNA